MPGMPYHLEKGVWGTVFEDHINHDGRQAVATLVHLRVGGEITALPFFGLPSLDNKADKRFGNEPGRIDHFRVDWLGWRPDPPDGPLVPQRPWRDLVAEALSTEPLRRRWAELVEAGHQAATSVEPLDKVIALSTESVAWAETVQAAAKEDFFDGLSRYPETGFWQQYFGDVDSILRETLATAIEQALGLPRPPADVVASLRDVTADDHQERVAEYRKVLQPYVDGAKTPRHLPLEIFWKCPQRWWEGWVTWRVGDGTGQVTVVLCTPGSGTPLLEELGYGRGTVRPDESHPTTSTVPTPRGMTATFEPGDHAERRMWVVSHEAHVPLPPPNTWKGRKQGAISVPPFGPSYVGVGPVVITVPSLMDGGAGPLPTVTRRAPAGTAPPVPSAPPAPPTVAGGDPQTDVNVHDHQEVSS